jgi:hypothetical protein
MILRKCFDIAGSIAIPQPPRKCAQRCPAPLTSRPHRPTVRKDSLRVPTASDRSLARVKKPEKFEVTGDCARFTPEGHVSLEEAVAMIGHAIAYCYWRRIPKLLVKTTRLTGYAPTTVFDQYWLVQEWARKARGCVAVAVVVKPHHFDPEKFGVVAAHNAGLRADMFTTEPEAMEFLHSPESVVAHRS